MVVSLHIVLLLSFKTSLNPSVTTFLTDAVMIGTLTPFMFVCGVHVVDMHRNGQVKAPWFVNCWLCRPI